MLCTMLRRSLIVGLGVSMVACMGTGIERSGAVAARATLSIRPVADGDPYVETVAAAAQDTLPEVVVTSETIYSRRLPPVDSLRLRAGSKMTLVDAVERAGPVPTGLAVAYEHEAEQPDQPRWSMVVVRRDEGMVLGPDTLVKPAWAPATKEPQELEGVFLLLGPDDGRAFEQLTIAHDGRRLAILDRDEVLMAPTVQEPIGGGQIMISPGGDSSAAELYERLTGAPLPAPPPPQP